MRTRRRGDLQQMLTRLPAMTIDDFQKGDAVILVSTEGNDSRLRRSRWWEAWSRS